MHHRSFDQEPTFSPPTGQTTASKVQHQRRSRRPNNENRTRRGSQSETTHLNRLSANDIMTQQQSKARRHNSHVIMKSYKIRSDGDDGENKNLGGIGGGGGGCSSGGGSPTATKRSHSLRKSASERIQLRQSLLDEKSIVSSNCSSTSTTVVAGIGNYKEEDGGNNRLGGQQRKGNLQKRGSITPIHTSKRTSQQPQPRKLSSVKMNTDPILSEDLQFGSTRRHVDRHDSVPNIGGTSLAKSQNTLGESNNTSIDNSSRTNKWSNMSDFHSSNGTDFSPSGDLLFDNSRRQNRRSLVPTKTSEYNSQQQQEQSRKDDKEIHHRSINHNDEDSILIEDLQFDHCRQANRRASMPNLGANPDNNNSNPSIMVEHIALKIANAELQSELQVAQSQLQKLTTNVEQSSSNMKRLQDQNNALQKRNMELEEKNTFFLKLMVNLERLGKLEGVVDKKLLEKLMRADTSTATAGSGLEHYTTGNTNDDGVQILVQDLPETRRTSSQLLERASSFKSFFNGVKISSSQSMVSSNSIEHPPPHHQQHQHPWQNKQNHQYANLDEQKEQDQQQFASASALAKTIRNIPQTLPRSKVLSSQVIDYIAQEDAPQQQQQQQKRQSQQREDQSEKLVDKDVGSNVPNFVQFQDVDMSDLRCSDLSNDAATFQRGSLWKKRPPKHFQSQRQDDNTNMSDIDEEQQQLQQGPTNHHLASPTVKVAARPIPRGHNFIEQMNNSCSVLSSGMGSDAESFSMWQSNGPLRFSITESLIDWGEGQGKSQQQHHSFSSEDDDGNDCTPSVFAFSSMGSEATPTEQK